MIVENLYELNMTREEILEALKDDDQYYSGIGRKLLSYSDTKALLKNPSKFKQPIKPSIPLLCGTYFHLSLLEPEKVSKMKIIDAKSRRGSKYLDLANGDLHLLKKEVDELDILIDSIRSNDAVRLRIQEEDVEYEVPNIGMIGGKYWKGKADILNHDRKMIIDLKTTSDINIFRQLAYSFNYDAQSYVYTQLFPGYGFGFVVVCKKTGQIGVFKASEDMLESGKRKVETAIKNYEIWIDKTEFERKNHYIDGEI